MMNAARIVSNSVAPASDVRLMPRLFFVSGFAAVLYQIVWQRVLFAIVGVNIEAVTLIVAAFILGLGLGSLWGGWLSRTDYTRLIGRFALVELAVGVFGLVSLQLFHAAGALTLSMPPWAVALTVFSLVVPPTMGMGATLPILTAYGVKQSGNVGVSVGRLYYVNTVGSAMAAFAAALALMRLLGGQRVVWLAAASNLGVAAAAWLLVERRRAQ
jgi:predicted membrane-bound spermidine synthase